MTTYVPNPVESSETNQAPDEAAREQIQSRTMERRPRRGALVFVSGFMLGALATTVASIFGRGRRTPFVLGNRNVSRLAAVFRHQYGRGNVTQQRQGATRRTIHQI